MFRASLAVATIFAGSVVLASCDADKLVRAADPSAPRIAVGDSVAGVVPQEAVGAASASYGFVADSGRTYKISWRERSASVSMVVRTDDGAAVYSEFSDSGSGAFKSLLFPASKGGGYQVVATGIAGSRFDLRLSATDGLPPWVALPDSFERDDRIVGATDLRADGSWQRHSLTTSGRPDVDWVRIAVDSGLQYTVVRRDSLAVGVSGGFYDQDSVPLSKDGWVANRKGHVYYRVAASSGRGGWYRLQLVVLKPIDADPVLPDEYENDNTMFTAKRIETNGVWQNRTLHLLPDGTADRDLVWFQCDSGRTYRVQFRSPVPAAYNAFIVPFNPDSTYPASTTNRQGDTVVVSVPCLRTGRYYVSVKTYSTAFPYSLAVVDSNGIDTSMLPGPEWTSKNRENALTLPDDTAAFTGKLHGTDTNWLRIPVRKGGRYELRIDEAASSPAFRGFVSIQDSAGRVLHEAEFRWNLSAQKVLEPTSDGEYFLRITRGTAVSAEILRYQVRVGSSLQVRDSLEPDDLPDKAATIPVGAPPFRRWMSRGDVDWMKIPVDSGRRIEVTVDGGVSAGLFSLDSLCAGERIPGTNTLDYLPRRTGYMLLRVAGTAGNQPYTVKVRTHPLGVAGACGAFAAPCLVLGDSVSVERKLAYKEEVWFKFPARSGALYRIDGLKSATNVGSVQFFASDSSALKDVVTKDEYGSYSFRSYYPAKKDDTVLFRFSNDWYQSGVAGIWFWVSEVRDDPSEPGDNSLAGALDLQVSDTWSTGSLSQGDRDILKLELDSGKVYLLDLTATDSLHARILLPDSTEEGRADGMRSTMRYAPGASGIRYLELTGRPAALETRWSVKLRAFDADGYVPTPNLKGATALATDGIPQKRRLVGADKDWVFIEVDSGASYRFEMSSTASVDLEFFSEDSIHVGSQYTWGVAAVQDLSLPRKGRIYVSIAPNYTEVADYTIKAIRKDP